MEYLSKGRREKAKRLRELGISVMAKYKAGNAEVVRRRRTSKAKVKTGCLTCKARHVKCDESKPVCQRCIKSDMRCDWMAVAEPKVVMTRGRMLMPKTHSSNTGFLSPSTRLFQSEQEQRYFRLFCDKISRELSGLFDSALWSRTVLQACVVDPGIRHIVVAIGALGYTNHVVTRLPLPSRSSDQALQLCYDEAQKHHRFALSQYGIAIRLLRKAAAELKSDVRTMLLGCVLTACFETFHGDHQSAISQIASGLKLVEDWHIGSQKGKNTNSLLGTTSPSPYTIEDELIQALGRLDLQAMSFLDPRDRIIHDRMRHYGQSSINSMPSRFQTVKEARIYLELVMRRYMHWVALVSNVDGEEGCLRHMKTSTPFPRMPPVVYGGEFDRWYQAFQPLLEQTRRAEGPQDYNASTLLKIHYLCSRFTFDVLSSERAVTAKDYTPMFTEIVSLCRIVLEHPDVRHADSRYRFDLHVITPLYITGLRCRDSGVRRDAIALLLSSPRREGVWDSILVGKIAQWIVDVEEENGLHPDSTPIGPGVSDLTIDFNLQARKVHLQCLQFRVGVECPVERDVVLTW